MTDKKNVYFTYFKNNYAMHKVKRRLVIEKIIKLQIGQFSI